MLTLGRFVESLGGLNDWQRAVCISASSRDDLRAGPIGDRMAGRIRTWHDLCKYGDWPTPAEHIREYPDLSVERCIWSVVRHSLKGIQDAECEWWWEAAALAKVIYEPEI